MWRLGYDGSLFMTLSDEVSFLTGSFYKLRLRCYAEGCQNGVLRFRQSLTYLDYQRIMEMCSAYTAGRGIEFSVSSALTDYIRSRQMHLEIRSRMGVELKAGDEKFSGQILEYEHVLDGVMVRKLRPQQLRDSFFMYAMGKSANFSVPGSGKTASVLGMYGYLQAMGKVKHIVVICPKNAFGSWIDEFRLRFGENLPLRLLNIHDAQYKSTNDRRTALCLDAGRCNLLLINYESVGSVVDILEQLVGEYALLVFDEVHKVKRVNGEYAQQALRIAHGARYTVVLTGTPIPNTYQDIYNLLHILFQDEYWTLCSV